MKRALVLAPWLLVVATACAGGCGGNTAKTQPDGGATGGGGGGGGAGPLVSDPGAIKCGSSSCPTPDEQCCLQPGAPSCIGKQICDRGRALACDEASDCTAGNVCCYSVFQSGFPDGIASQCAPDCIRNSIAYQACKTDADCTGTGMLCVATTCGGQTFGTCGQIPPAYCH